MCLCGVCSHVVILGLSVRLSRYLCECGDCDVCTVVCVACLYAECVRVTAMLVWRRGVVVLSAWHNMCAKLLVGC